MNSENETVLIEYQYFGNVNYYFELINSKYCQFDEYVEWRKSSFSNRCTVLGANGAIDLSIPLVGGRDQRRPFYEVTTSEKYDWKANHWKTLVSCYGRSPWFHHYQGSLSAIYYKEYSSILGFLKACEQWVEQQIKFHIVEKHIGSPTQAVPHRDLRFVIRPGHPFVEGRPIIRYPQVFQERLGFVPNLSILDLIFCEGPLALSRLKEKQTMG